MNKIILTTVTCLLCTVNIFAQAPQKMTYQAVIRDAGNTLLSNTNVGIQISILTGSQTGTAVYIERHALSTNTNGLATLSIGEGIPVAGTFAGIDWSTGSYFIKTETDPTGGTTYSISGTSQLLSVPYALYAESAGGGNGATLDGAYDQGGAGAGRIITADAGPVQINGSGTNTAALGILFTGTGNAINATNNNAANQFAVIQGVTNSSTQNNSAVFGQSIGAARAISGEATATSTSDAAIRGNNLRTTGGIGVEGVGFNGVSGQTNYRAGYGVFGQNFDLVGPLSENSVGVGGVGYIGVLGQSSDNINGAGVASLDNIIALGTLTVSGTKNFRIDHPQDPANKYLNHFSIESDEVLNIYRGTVAFDVAGNAVVQLPEWFDAVNKNASYQLTPIGGYAPIFIAEKIKDGRFVISGGMNGMEVSWAVYAERNDPYLEQHPEAREVEVQKTEREAGKYLRPDLFGQPAESGIIQPIQEPKK